jgi:hypothetical protein
MWSRALQICVTVSLTDVVDCKYLVRRRAQSRVKKKNRTKDDIASFIPETNPLVIKSLLRGTFSTATIILS